MYKEVQGYFQDGVRFLCEIPDYTNHRLDPQLEVPDDGERRDVSS